MKIKNLLTIFCLLTSLHLFSQTKLISHKSHSGSTANFATALESNLFDIKDSNFGVAPIREIKKAQLDSLIFLSDTSVIMVTSEVCGWIENGIPAKKQKINGQKLWTAGKDTVFHHQLFTRNNSIEKIKKKLKKEYFFKNPIDSVKFINHEIPEKEKEKEKKQIQEQKEVKSKIKRKIKRKEARQKRKKERKEKRWGKKNCDCDCDCDEEKPAPNNNENTNQNTDQNNDSKSENQSSNSNQNIKMQMLPSIGSVSLLAFVFGLLFFKWQNRI